MGVPLAALAIQPPPDPLRQIGQALAIKGAVQNQAYQQQSQPLQLQERQLQVQQGQQQLADQKAMTTALQNWDGKDPEELPGLVLKQGGSATAVFGLKNQIISQRKNLAEADDATLKNQQMRNDLITGQLDAIKAAPPEQKQALYQQTLQKLGPTAQLPPQYPGDDKVDQFEKLFMGHKQILEDELNRRKVAATEQEAQAKAQAAQTGARHFEAELPGGPLNKVTQDIAVATNPQIQQGKIAVAAAEGAARANVEAAAARGNNAALANVPKQLVTPATAAAEKANAEYADAKSVSDRMQATMDAAHKGNVVSYQIIPEEGTLQITTSQGVHRINKTEIDQYAGGGSLWQRMEGHFGKQLTGKSIPDSVLKDMQDIQDIQRKGADERYNNKLKSINQTYGSGFQPVKMGGMDTNTQAHPFFSQFGGTARPQ